MKFAQLLPNVAKMFSSFKLGGRMDPKLSKLDFGMLEVAMMVAALDGEILGSEVEAFDGLARKCRGFADSERSDLRRVFVLWVSICVSDGEFSAIERKALDALQDRFGWVMLERAMDEERRWAALVPALQMSDGPLPSTKKITLLEEGFVDRAAALVKDLAIPSKREKAEAAPVAFVGQ